MEAVGQFADPGELAGAIGRTYGPTGWLEVTQERVDLFAEATGDHQWIHVDPERAKDGPFGTTIAHGYLTLAVSNLFVPQLVRVGNVAMGLNYGVDRVRFPTPVPVGGRIRGTAEIVAATDVPGGVQATVRIAVELEGSAKPACVVDSVSRYLR